MILRRCLSFPDEQPSGAPSGQVRAAGARAAPVRLCRPRSGVLTAADLLPAGAACLPVQEPDWEAGSRQAGLVGWGPALSSRN